MLVLILAASPEKVVAVLIPAVLMGLKFVVLMVRVGASDRVHVVQTLTVRVGINVVIINVVTWIIMSFVAKIRTAVKRFRNVVKMVRVSHLVNVVEMVTVIQMKSVAVISVFQKMSVVMTQTVTPMRNVV
jgi:hypothetical protein